MKTYSFLFFLLINLSYCFAQNNQNSISIKAIQGITIFTSDYQLKGNFYGGEIAYRLNMANNDVGWIKTLNVKDVAITAAWLNTQGISSDQISNPKRLIGSTYAALTIVDFGIFNVGKTAFIFSPGIGFSYTTQTYYTNNNPLVGSHINLAIQAGLRAETPISPSNKIMLGIDFFHYSNSAFKLPNYGIDNINASLGITQNLHISGPNRKAETFDSDNKQSFEVSIGAGRRGFIQAGNYINPQTGNPIPLPDSAAQKSATSDLYLLGMYAGYAYRLNSIFSIKLGTDVVYYFKPFSYNDFYRTYQESGTSFDHLALGVSLGTDIWLGRMALMFNYGYYLHYKTVDPTHYYWVLGGKYYLTNWMALNAKIYIHGFEAHYANFGFVFNIKKKNANSIRD
ncbi:MAG: acyloxyacyl hydrolase [Candidatus Pedobacter colombiensis]|uniref:Acyloxyacyl hydrolase n=1 Tax=Candidatus Pedobacter colombiensis TaxID=3121371 RepID=A0AAJ6B5T0_9SPHI|nr:acyloxyacyl hydrolase [Pedobacter sp.]WEK17821.1 MAG: acyloxyacyl hydrolase [Pedobacter sp.]